MVAAFGEYDSSVACAVVGDGVDYVGVDSGADDSGISWVYDSFVVGVKSCGVFVM